MSRKCICCKQSLQIDKFLKTDKMCIECSEKRNKKMKCQICGKCATHGLKIDKIVKWCRKHAALDAIDLVHRLCIAENCQTRCTFGLEIINDDGKIAKVEPSWCRKHAPLDAVDLKTKKCIEKGCKTVANYNLRGSKKSLWCRKHAPSEAINVRSRMCIAPSCETQPSFALEGDNSPSWCKKHAPLEAIDIISKKCTYYGCKKKASYYFIGDRSNITCASHRSIDSILLTSRTICNNDECSTTAHFGFKIDNIVLKCSKHKECGMIDLLTPRCEYPSCEVQPSFGVPDELKKRWCVKHKPSNAITVTNYKCTECYKTAHYEIAGSYPTKCATHRTKDMIFNPRKRCINKHCKELAVYGCSRKSIHCETHKTTDDILVAEYPCKQCGNLDILDENGVCITTCGFLPQFEIYKKHQKRDEKRILHLLTEEFGEPTSYDSIVKNDCGYRERPDIVYDIPESKIRIIIEIDENGDNHGSDCSNLSKEQNELNRMINIFSSFGEETHTLFIRYNPNKYYVNNIKQTITKTDRENILVKWIRKFIDTSSDVFNNSNLAVLYLFYNEYNTNTIHPKCVDILKAKIYCCGKCSNMLEDKSNYNNIPRAFLYYDKEDYTHHQLTH